MSLILILILILLIIIALLLVISRGDKKYTGGYREVVIDNIHETNPVEYTDDFYGDVKKHNIRGDKYVDIKSNKQIQQVVRFGSVAEYARLNHLLGKHINEFGINRIKILQNMLNNKPDNVVYDILCKYYTRNEDERSLNQAKEAFRPLYGFLMKNENTKINSLLDIGCGQGYITAYIKELLKCDKAACVEVDKSLSNPDIEYSYLQEDKEYKLPYENSSFDLITAFMSLHHVHDLDTMISEISRVLKPGGYFFIKEHDCWNAFDAMLVDIEHAIFIHCDPKQSIDDFYCVYKNYYGWDKQLSSHFKYIAADYYYPALRNEISPTRAWYGIYQKLDENSVKN